MNYPKQDELETYVERHRADFDLHEPRPELWAAIEKQLHGEGSEVATSVMSIVPDSQPQVEPQATLPLMGEQPVATKRWAWVERYSIAAALAVLLLAAGLGEAWKSGRVAEERAVAGALPIVSASTANAADEALYLAPSGRLVVSKATQNSNARLDTAVRGMEMYYVSQLADRKAELSQLAPGATADWARELVGLDSSYQQLKRELPQHPQPEVVLKAMNRNLQIRLDILDQQLEVRGAAQTARASEARGEYALADSRHSPEVLPHHDR